MISKNENSSLLHLYCWKWNWPNIDVLPMRTTICMLNISLPECNRFRLLTRIPLDHSNFIVSIFTITLGFYYFDIIETNCKCWKKKTKKKMLLIIFLWWFIVLMRDCTSSHQCWMIAIQKVDDAVRLQVEWH